VTRRRAARHRRSAGAAPRDPRASRVGLFGLLGSGNIGNDGSLEAVLTYLRTDHPDIVLDAMCAGPQRLEARYGVAATPLQWNQKYERASGVTAMALKVLGKGIDPFRTASWVRRHDVVIVPGAGAFEATLPIRPWGLPYSLLLMCGSGKLFGTKVAFVSVGANFVNKRLTRWLSTTAARLAFYRSYRDVLSQDAMRQRGLDAAKDPVFPDLVFALPTPPHDAGDPRTVGVGVMAYYGSNDDRADADEIHAQYMETMKDFVRWLADEGYRIRLFAGDNRFDDSVVQEILADLRSYKPGLDSAWAVGDPVTSLRDLMREIAPVGTVVAIRYHNVISALKLSKPTLSLSYATKHDVLMAGMGLSEFCLPARTVDVDQMIERFTQLQARSAELRATVSERNATTMQRVERQFALLSALLLPGSEPAPQAAAKCEPAPEACR
jgi:polysaccharide pyruvyl transferase WcaK-like protein